MESEKVKEIKKALEFQRDGLMYLENGCVEVVYCKDILNLINELQSENERLNKALVNNLEAYKDGFNEGAGLKKGVDNKLKIENQQLKDRIAELEKLCNKTYEDLTKEIDRLEESNKKLKQSNKNILMACNNFKNDHLKQFAERMKEISCEMYLKEQLHLCIDETLKEFIND